MNAKRSWYQTIVWIFLGVIVATVVLVARPGICATPAEITLLTQDHFVPAWEQELRKQVERA
jgi:hypothetical protein